MKKVLDSYNSQNLIKKYVSIPKSKLVKNLSNIKLKYPLVLKIISKQAVHKTDIKGVRTVNNKEELEKEFFDLLDISRKKKLKLEGIMMQEFIEGEQLIIGIKKDPVFGHVLLFGLGGIFTEILEDVSIRKCPINLNDAQEMIDELKGKKLFYGFRGKNLNRNLLKKNLVNVSKMPEKYKNLLELDINPFILNNKESKAVDVRIVLE